MSNIPNDETAVPMISPSEELCVEDVVAATQRLLGLQEVHLWYLEAECLSGDIYIWFMRSNTGNSFGIYHPS